LTLLIQAVVYLVLRLLLLMVLGTRKLGCCCQLSLPLLLKVIRS
jgi:hypothetical protein